MGPCGSIVVIGKKIIIFPAYVDEKKAKLVIEYNI